MNRSGMGRESPGNDKGATRREPVVKVSATSRESAVNGLARHTSMERDVALAARGLELGMLAVLLADVEVLR